MGENVTDLMIIVTDNILQYNMSRLNQHLSNIQHILELISYVHFHLIIVNSINLKLYKGITFQMCSSK
jgi:hypothetical protein